MNRAVRTLLCLAAFAVFGSPRTAAADAAADAAVAVAGAPDSVPAAPGAVQSARTAYQNAWAQRQSGAFDAAARTATDALEKISDALAAGPDQSTRGDLNELQSRLAGLRDAAVHDKEAAAAAAQSGNVADDKVLNAPAADEIEPQMNDQVLRWIEFFTGGGRSTFERWLKRSGRYMELFRQALHREGLPPDLVHLVFVESGFNLNARSVSAAVGPWQFLRSTAKLFGLTVNQWVDERRDPEKSTVAAARYLKHLYSIFGDWPLALASYNAGEGTVLRAIKHQGTTNYWDLKLPRQTEDYVPQFMAILAISRDPSRYGFDDVALDEPMEFDEVALKGAIDLRVIAKMADCSYDEIKLLNPAVLHHAASGGASGVTTLRVPRGKGPALMEKLENGAKLPAVDLTFKHGVRRGETLNSIARTYHVSPKALALANGIGRKRPLRRGMTLVVPASLGAPGVAQLEDGDPRASTAYVPARAGFMPRTEVLVQGDSQAEGRKVHTVHRGETLAGIADQYGVSVDDLKRWNRLKSNRVARGTRLKVRTGDAAVADKAPDTGTPASTTEAPIATVASAAPTVTEVSAIGDDDGDAVATTASAKPAVSKARASHTSAKAKATRTVIVRRGTTLGQIAQKHGVGVREIMRLNGLRTPQVRAGQRLRIPTS